MLVRRGTACPPRILHTAAAAYRAYRNVNIPYHFQQLFRCQACITCPETLMALDRKDQFQIPAFITVIEKPVIPDFLETRWKHMHQVTADEIRMCQCDRPAWSARFPAPGRKSNILPVHRQDPAVGYGDFMGISAGIFNGIAKAVKGLFDVRAPVLFIKAVKESCPFVRIQEPAAGFREAYLPVFIECPQPRKEFPFELWLLFTGQVKLKSVLFRSSVHKLTKILFV
jgi:hypothetical protein